MIRPHLLLLPLFFSLIIYLYNIMSSFLIFISLIGYCVYQIYCCPEKGPTIKNKMVYSTCKSTLAETILTYGFSDVKKACSLFPSLFLSILPRLLIPPHSSSSLLSPPHPSSLLLIPPLSSCSSISARPQNSPRRSLTTLMCPRPPSSPLSPSTPAPVLLSSFPSPPLRPGFWFSLSSCSLLIGR